MYIFKLLYTVKLLRAPCVLYNIILLLLSTLIKSSVLKANFRILTYYFNAFYLG